ncbi:hypothetical protein D9M71_631910 [compost metagenome]
MPGALHAALPAFGCAGFAAEQGQATVQVGTAAAQNVAFTEQCGDVASHVGQPQVLAAQQQVGDARMRRQFGHGLAVGAEAVLTVGLERAQTPQQVQRLAVRGSRRLVEPAQLFGGDAPAR